MYAGPPRTKEQAKRMETFKAKGKDGESTVNQGKSEGSVRVNQNMEWQRTPFFFRGEEWKSLKKSAPAHPQGRA